MSSSKVVVRMTPYNAISVLAFCREFVNEDLENDYKFQALREAVQELEDQLNRNLTDEHWEEIDHETEVNDLIGKSPRK